MKHILFAAVTALALMTSSAAMAGCGDCTNSAINCPDGYYVSGWNGTTFNCSPLTAVCGNGKVLTGIKKGNPVCEEVNGGGEASCSISSPQDQRYGTYPSGSTIAASGCCCGKILCVNGNWVTIEECDGSSNGNR